MIRLILIAMICVILAAIIGVQFDPMGNQLIKQYHGLMVVASALLALALGLLIYVCNHYLDFKNDVLDSRNRDFTP